MSSRKVTKATTKKPRRIRRTSSNVFAMFDQAQIQEFKEAFNLIDQNHDGFIDKDDLQEMLASLGIRVFPRVFPAVGQCCAVLLPLLTIPTFFIFFTFLMW